MLNYSAELWPIPLDYSVELHGLNSARLSSDFFCLISLDYSAELVFFSQILLDSYPFKKTNSIGLFSRVRQKK